MPKHSNGTGLYASPERLLFNRPNVCEFVADKSCLAPGWARHGMNTQTPLRDANGELPQMRKEPYTNWLYTRDVPSMNQPTNSTSDPSIYLPAPAELRVSWHIAPKPEASGCIANDHGNWDVLHLGMGQMGHGTTNDSPPCSKGLSFHQGRRPQRWGRCG